MAIKDDIENKVNSYFSEPYEIEETTIIPSTDYSKLTFGNKALVSELCFLFADIRNSSELHNTYGFKTAARVYQSFHDICVRIINNKDGEVRGFDGDRTMGVFSGKTKCSNATETALKIKWAVVNILNPKLKTPLKVGIGIDFGKVMITKVGKGRDENNNDLVWIGQACNYASHLSGYGSNSTIITERIYNRINKDSKYSDSDNMWKKTDLELKNKKQITVYTSHWGWVL